MTSLGLRGLEFGRTDIFLVQFEFFGLLPRIALY